MSAMLPNRNYALFIDFLSNCKGSGKGNLVRTSLDPKSCQNNPLVECLPNGEAYR
jgi:hypothetical protein